ncbi:hypothetical protein [Luteimonas sp. 3794]|uniref:hypothetical protein n=1 Tax=Luteimonas sp. 3794 TaxID=2817730 RepID=UPI00285DA4F8|nr:hypothetical protein [Luteimonas sp. 3794]MDR6990365.1 hypothetical protein [Luteimonas sp. 3794]
MSQPTFVTHYMVRRPKAGNQDASRSFKTRIGNRALAANDPRATAPVQTRYTALAQRAG